MCNIQIDTELKQQQHNNTPVTAGLSCEGAPKTPLPSPPRSPSDHPDGSAGRGELRGNK